MRRSNPSSPGPRRLARSIILAIVVFVEAGCYDSGFGSPSPTDVTDATQETIAGLVERFAGKPFRILENISVEGVVVSSDRAGNFYRTLCIQQGTAGIEIMAGVDQLHNQYPVGCPVVVHLQGLVVAQSHGMIQVGNPPVPGSGYETDYIGSRAALELILVRQSEQLQVPVPETVTIPELRVDRCGTLVRIDNLRYLPEETENAGEDETNTDQGGKAGTAAEENRWSGYRRFVDRSGREIQTYVRTYADFADEQIPDGELSLVGILQFDDSAEGCFVIKPRDEKDCLH